VDNYDQTVTPLAVLTSKERSREFER